MDFIVPFTMILAAFHVASSQFLVADFPTFLVGAVVDPRMDFQSRFCGCRADRFNYDLQGLQRRALPIAGNVAKHPMFDLVPFARSRGIVVDFDDQTRLVTPLLQLHLPQAGPRTVAAAAVSCHQQPFGSPVAFTTKLLPAAPGRSNPNFSRVVTDAYRHARA